MDRKKYTLRLTFSKGSQQQFLMEDVGDDEANQIASIVSSIVPLPTTGAATSTAAIENSATIIQGVKLVVVFFFPVYVSCAC